MKRTIRFSLSTDSIENAIQQIRWYKEELRYKTSIFVQRLAEIGIIVIDSHKFTEGDSDTSFEGVTSYVRLEEGSTSSKAILYLDGKDVAFVEFGAGVHYNGSVGSSPNPNGQKFGFTIGSYGKGQGANDSWVYYDEESGKFKTSHGTKAAMPMYYAHKYMCENFARVAKEVFG